jgi:hypothetical protein
MQLATRYSLEDLHDESFNWDSLPIISAVNESFEECRDGVIQEIEAAKGLNDAYMDNLRTDISNLQSRNFSSVLEYVRQSTSLTPKLRDAIKNPDQRTELFVKMWNALHDDKLEQFSPNTRELTHNFFDYMNYVTNVYEDARNSVGSSIAKINSTKTLKTDADRAAMEQLALKLFASYVQEVIERTGNGIDGLNIPLAAHFAHFKETLRRLSDGYEAALNGTTRNLLHPPGPDTRWANFARSADHLVDRTDSKLRDHAQVLAAVRKFLGEGEGSYPLGETVGRYPLSEFNARTVDAGIESHEEIVRGEFEEATA